jgi:hypothetical protein
MAEDWTGARALSQMVQTKDAGEGFQRDLQTVA